jgi:GNAT superfamily N-acetyltransferase
MQLAETEAKALGCTRLGLHVFAINKVAHHLYESCGYNVTDLSMVKTLV